MTSYLQNSSINVLISLYANISEIAGPNGQSFDSENNVDMLFPKILLECHKIVIIDIKAYYKVPSVYLAQSGNCINATACLLE